MKRIFKWLISVVLVSLMLGGGWLWYQYNQFLQTPLPVTEQNAVFTVQSGSNIRQVAGQLNAKGIIAQPWWFVAYARLSQQADKLKAGEYQLETGMTPATLLAKLVSGQSIQYPLTIVEGKTFKDILASIRNHPTLRQTLASARPADMMQQLGATGEAQPEGWFMPDTYHFPRETTDAEVLQRSYKAMRDYLQRAWEQREPHPALKTPYDALILASIVEKETGLPEERPLVARVFLNRLQKGMLLQTDPTVIYGLGEKYDGNLRKIDLQTDTPYNTYTRAGLPPTPIATPSKAAIDAVMHPATSNALYFVAITPGGASRFSETLQEHNRAVQQYIQNQKAFNSQQPKQP